MNSQPQLDSDLRLSCEVVNERIIANALIEHGTQRTWPNSRHVGEILPAQARPKPASGRSRAKAALGNTTCPPSRLRGRFVAILPRSANAKANECQARCRHESLPGCRLLRIDRLGARSEMTSSDTRFVFTRESVSNRQARRKKRVFNRDAASLASTC